MWSYFLVTSPPIIGSGRVGPRQPAKPQFQFQTSGLDHHHHPHHHPSHGHPSAQHQGGGGKQSHHRNNDSFNRNSSGRKSDKEAKRGPKPGASQPTTSNKQPQTAAGGSVQDRLNRNRSTNIDRNDNSIKVSVNNGNEAPPQAQPKPNATLKTISKIIEKNAEIDEKLARQMHQENEKMANRVKELRMQDGA